MPVQPLRIGIIRFPGSNCDFDTWKWVEQSGHTPEFIWYQDTTLKPWQLMIVPGGFAFGDRVYKQATADYSIDPGMQALQSPVMKLIRQWAEKGLPMLGICNGFQILTKAGLLPGALKQNLAKKFFCDDVMCRVVGRSFFNDPDLYLKVFKIPIAHGYGRYVLKPKEYQEMKKHGQIFLEYDGVNPNGSYQGIAGVCNTSGNVWGLMPHPERSSAARYFIKAIERYVQA